MAKRSTKKAKTYEDNTSSKATLPKSIKQSILVLGMHRSGTSAITRVLNLLGADLAHNLMPPVPGNNELGFWESSDIQQIHDDMLASSDSSWDDIRPLNEEWFLSPEANKYKIQILDILDENFSSSSLFVIKDPRICRFVPFWLNILNQFGAEPKVVISIRNPFEVAASLKSRDGFMPAKSMLLWLRHVLEAEHDTRDIPRSIITYDALLKDRREVVSKISDQIHVKWPHNTQGTQVKIDQFLSPKQQHHVFPLEKFDKHPEIVDWIKRAYQALLKIERNVDNISTDHELDKISEELHKAESAFCPILIAEQIEIKEQELANELLKSEVEAVQNELSARDGELKQIKFKLSARDGELKQIKFKLSARDSELRLTKYGLEAARIRISELLSSKSWTITEPLRQIHTFLLRLYSISRRIIGSLNLKTAFHFTQSWRERRWIKTIAASGLFDKQYYVQQRADLGQMKIDPILHFIRYCSDEGLKPNPLFDPEYYMKHDPEVAAAGINPLIHFIEYGAKEGRKPSPLFDPLYYLDHNPNVAREGINPLRHYLEVGAWEGRLPCLINEGDIDSQILKICQTRLDDPKALEFDANFYTKFYTDMKNINDPEKARRHYYQIGKAEGRFASFGEFLSNLPAHPLDIPIDFSPNKYLELNPDVAANEGNSKYNALAHYLRSGSKERRLYSINQFYINKIYPESTPYLYNTPIHELKDRTSVCVLTHIYDTEIWQELATYIHNFGEIPFDLYINIVDKKWAQSLHSQIRNEFPKAHIYISPNKGRDIGGFFLLFSNIDIEKYDILCLLHTKKSPHLSLKLSNKWRRDLLDAILLNEQIAAENVSLFLNDETVGLVGSKLWYNNELHKNKKNYFNLLNRLSIQGENRKCEYLSGTIMLVRPNVLQKIFEIVNYDEFEIGDNVPLEFHLDGQLAHGIERVIGNVVRHFGYRFIWR